MFNVNHQRRVDQQQLMQAMEQWRRQNAQEQGHQETSRSDETEVNEVIEKIKTIGMRVLSIIGLFAASVLTFGIITLIPCYFQNKKIRHLESNIDGDSKEISFKWSRILYQRKESDPKNFKSTLPSKELAGIEEMDELLASAKSWGASDLSKKFGDIIGDGNSQVISHRWLVYLLVKHAGLEYACDQVTASLLLNPHLKVGRSEACQIQKEGEETVHNRFVNTDEWTPKDISKLPNGVDPISLKYLLFHIEKDPESLKHFETLLLSDAFNKSDDRIKQSKKWLNENKGKSSLVKDAAFLVDEISRALEDRYPKTLPRREKADSPNAKELGVDFDRYLDFDLSSSSLLEKIKSTAIEALKIFGLVIASVLTVGMFPFGLYLYQEHRIKGLEDGTVKREGVKTTYHAPKYEKTQEDAVGGSIDDKSLNSFLKLAEEKTDIKDLSSLEPLVEGAFTHAFQDVLEIAKSNKHGVVFSKSPKINEQQLISTIWVDTYVNNKNALYNWIAYKLIPKGSVRCNEKTKEHRLFFNDQLSVGFSHACSVPFRDQKKVVNFFLNEDEWSVDGKTDREGVDPVSIHWILHKLDKCPAAKEALEILLLSALIPKEHDALRKAKLFIEENGEEATLVLSAYKMISTLGRSFGSVYKNPFYLLWDNLADDDKAADPLLKEEGGLDASQVGSYVDWIPELSASPEFPVYPLVKAQSVLTPVWNDIHKYRIDETVKSIDKIPHEESEALEMLSKQYYWIHVNVGAQPSDFSFFGMQDNDGAGCILSALCINIFQATEKLNNIDPKSMREAFGDYLRTLLCAMDNKPTEIDKENYEYFKREVEQCTKGEGGTPEGWTVAEYANWLQYGYNPPGKKVRGHFDMGQLEIDLFCRVFRIGVQVFRGGEPYRLEKGLMLPIRSYGPRTREQIILFNATGRTSEGFSFYALMPKLRDPITSGNPEESDPPDVESALRHNRAFWGANHGKEWGQQIELVS